MLTARLYLPFIRSQGLDGQGVNLVTDQRAKTLVYELVSRERPLAGKFCRDHKRLKVGVVVTENLDDRAIESGFNQATYFDWVHTE